MAYEYVRDTNSAIIRSIIALIWNTGNFASMPRFYSDNYIRIGRGDLYGLEEEREWIQSQRKMFPDLVFVVDCQVAEGDRVVTFWTAQGTYKGTYTRRRVQFEGVHLHVLANGKIVEGRRIYDVEAFIRQLGSYESAP